MDYTTVFDEIIFVEGRINYIENKGTVIYKKETFYNEQLKNLNAVKQQLADKAKRLGANAIINFEYGQKNTSWFRSMLLSFDDNVNWYGSGTAVVLSENTVGEIKDHLSKS